MITNQDADIEYVNPGFCNTTGYSNEEVLGQNARVLQSADIDAEIMSDLWGTVTSGENWHGEIHAKKKNGDDYQSGC